MRDALPIGHLRETRDRTLGDVRFRLFAAVAALASAQVAGPAIAQDYTLEGGSFGPEQVARGQEQYVANCAGCHGEDLRSAVSTAPDLTGPVFRFNWLNDPLSTKFEVIRTTMPQGNAGGLSDAAYADIIAYILSFNGVRETHGELPADSNALKGITITQP
ncbi:c-type cytochrome [Pelagibacterium xiamenense]|uniref:c-type cytochrome n=1 Tax=Pelagibacterium xiamenense TaxID=2901140 RepID=UPI001E4F642D|nr:cytochrome c [Pelagibacterium xiamenense]MCD7059587.1 cytochrome c [Pelagibacterium xiamenense]